MPGTHRPGRRDPTGRTPRRPSARDPAAATAPTVRTVLGGDRGAVTVEAALALCSLVAVMVLAVAAVAGASAHLRCLDAAREAARLVARGEPDRAREAATEIAPRGAKIAIAVAGDQVQVDVSTAVVPGLPGLSLDSRAVGVLEPAALLTSGDLTSGGLTSGGPASGGPADPIPEAPDDPVAAGDTGGDRWDGPVTGVDRPPADTDAAGGPR